VTKLTAKKFYGEYHGHRVQDLEFVLDVLGTRRERPVMYLVGDSSLDNKFWIPETADAPNGYADVLKTGNSFCDISYHLNARLEEEGGHMVAINAAVEETRLEPRARGRLEPQDIFVRDNLRPDDVLVVNVGGNDGEKGGRRDMKTVTPGVLGLTCALCRAGRRG
jgi:hypothetical protein